MLDDPVEHRTGPPGEVRHSCGDPRGLRELFLTLRAGTVSAELERTVRWHELSGHRAPGCPVSMPPPAYPSSFARQTSATNSRSGSFTSAWIVVTTGQGHFDEQIRQSPLDCV